MARAARSHEPGGAHGRDNSRQQRAALPTGPSWRTMPTRNQPRTVRTAGLVDLCLDKRVLCGARTGVRRSVGRGPSPWCWTRPGSDPPIRDVRLGLRGVGSRPLGTCVTPSSRQHDPCGARGRAVAPRIGIPVPGSASAGLCYRRCVRLLRRAQAGPLQGVLQRGRWRAEVRPRRRSYTARSWDHPAPSAFGAGRRPWPPFALLRSPQTEPSWSWRDFMARPLSEGRGPRS